MSVSSPTGAKLPHSHGMAAGENYKKFFSGCRDAAGRERKGDASGKREGMGCGCAEIFRVDDPSRTV